MTKQNARGLSVNAKVNPKENCDAIFIKSGKEVGLKYDMQEKSEKIVSENACHEKVKKRRSGRKIKMKKKMIKRKMKKRVWKLA